MKPRPKRDIALWVRRFAGQRHYYERYADVLKQMLDSAVRQAAPLALVQARPKSLESFAYKIWRKNWKYANPLTDITDLCGARVVTTTKGEVEAVSDFIRTHFDIDTANSVNVRQRMKPSEFGYLSVHYVVQLRRGVRYPVDVPGDLYPRSGRPMKAEIQVRTLLEHAWAVFTHDRSYKSGLRLPEDIQRELAALAARLEETDNAFERILAALGTYSGNLGMHALQMPADDEVRTLTALLKQSPGDIALVLKLANLLMMLGRWDEVTKLLARQPAGDERISGQYGIAACMARSRGGKAGRGQVSTAAACRSMPLDVLCRVGIWRVMDEVEAEKRCREALKLDPADPDALAGFLETAVGRAGSTGPLKQATGLDAAVRRCRDHINAGVNLPWAFYRIGFFELLRGEPCSSLVAYAKAMELSTSRWVIEASLEALERLAGISASVDGYEWAHRLLLLGLAVRFPTADTRRRLAELATPDRPRISEPVVIVAGGCDVSVEKRLRRTYKRLLVKAFARFRGTVVCGGTTAGISGLAGDVQAAYPAAVYTIGYVPKLTPADVTVDGRYRDIRKTNGTGFTALEPLQTWTDLVASGIHPERVCMLGFNGGPISAVDYRMALALGARVAVIRGSGREAARILPDSDWGGSHRLVHLEPDAATLQAFINYGRSRMHPARVRERIAIGIHEAYREDQSRRRTSLDPAMAEWRALVPGLKESNRQQADHIGEKLRMVGCAVVKAGKPGSRPFRFSDRQVEMLAEVEHARWCIERLAAGWKLGPKDTAAKTSPYLVSWAGLSEKVKDYDRVAVRQIPALLARVGLTVGRARASRARRKPRRT